MYGVVYLITNSINGRRYCGQTTDTLKSRWYQHCKSTSSCVYLSKAIKKYGKENFKIEVVIRCNNQKELDSRESFCIKIYNTLSPSGYNLTTGGEHPCQLLETRNKRSAKLKGKKLTSEHAKKISLSSIGKKGTFTGRTHTDETKKKISEAQLDAKNHMFGKIQSQESNDKRSAKLKGRKKSKETIKKIADANRGRKNTAETIKKMSDAKKGKKHTLETRKKQSEAQKGKIFTETHLENLRKAAEKKPLPSLETRKKQSIAAIRRGPSQATISRRKPIICLENNIIYESVNRAAVALDLNRSAIILVLKGQRKSTGGFTFKLVPKNV